MARKRNKHGFRNAVVFFLIIAILTLLAYSYRWIHDYLQERMATFELENIEIRGNHILSRGQVLALCGVNGSEKLLKVKPVDLVQRLKSSKYVKAAAVVRSLPATLRISLVERKPIAFIYGRGLNLIDNEGVLLPVPKSNQRWNLPFISGVDLPLGKLGERTVSQKAIRGVKVLRYLDILDTALNELISEIDFSHDKYYRLILVGGGAEVRIKKRNYQQDLFILSKYAEQYLNWDELDEIEYVDVRFDDQLIVRRTNS